MFFVISVGDQMAGSLSFPATKWSMVVRHSMDWKPWQRRLTTLNTLFSSSMRHEGVIDPVLPIGQDPR